MAVTFGSVDRTFSVQGGEVFSSALLQILAKIMLELAFFAEFASLGSEFVTQCSSTAEREFVTRATKSATGVLAFLFLVFLVIFAFTFSAIASISLVVAVVGCFCCVVIDGILFDFGLIVALVNDVSDVLST